MSLLAAACGGEASELDGIATLAPESAGQPGESAASAEPADQSEPSFEDAQLEFAACMRETIPEWPDPDPDVQGGRLGFRPEGLEELGIDFGGADFQTALDECQELLRGVVGGGPDRTAEEQAELEDQLLSIFECVRARPGFDTIPDPDFDQPGFGIRELVQGGEFDGAELREAMRHCQDELGVDGLGGPGPGGSRSTGAGPGGV